MTLTNPTMSETLELYLDRRWKKDTYTIGVLSITDRRLKFSETCEDKDRGLKQTDTIAKIKELKVPGETAIPKGTYKVTLDIVSPKYAAVAWYWQLCRGKMPRLLSVTSRKASSSEMGSMMSV